MASDPVILCVNNLSVFSLVETEMTNEEREQLAMSREYDKQAGRTRK